MGLLGAFHFDDLVYATPQKEKTMENENTAPEKATEPKTKLDEMDRLNAHVAYLDAAAAKNAVVALDSRVKQMMAEAQLTQNQKVEVEKEAEEKQTKLKHLMEKIRVDYAVPEGWQVDIATGVIAPPKK